ncbi:MAG: ArdC-like ssDNA-binding domain-containing protein [Fimbriimonadaceae bacterium]|nr:ArdC-like ssDNA-binding domain-containing protein [Fimbriimonadaceae bacterium]
MFKEQIKTLATDALAQLAIDLESGNSQTLTAYLKAMGKFHRYSLHNTMLIVSQRPDATHVAGYGTWKQLGRWVKKGEKGISILIPVKYRRRDQEPLVEEPEECSIGFMGGYVFDISQTEGEDLPEFATVEGDPMWALDQLKLFAIDWMIKVELVPNLNGAKGVSKGRHIQILDSLSSAEEFGVLVHEIAHELLHRGDRKPEIRTRELEAEAVSFVVCNAVGLETNSACADYIRLYNGDAQALHDSLTHIHQAAGEVLDYLL